MVKDPETEVEITDPAEIRKVSLAYCVNLLTNRAPKEDFKEEVDLKILVHDARMKEILEDDIEFSRDIFDNSLKAVKAKHKKYEFILKSGNSAQESLFKLYGLVWNSENFPSMWRDTTIIQLYKGKGKKEELSNQRNIHTKLEIPKLFSHTVITAAKEKIIQNITKLVQSQGIQLRNTYLLFKVQSNFTIHVEKQ